MPGKREVKALQEEVTNQEQWDDLMGKEAMTVVDVYQKWCGPCLATISLFRKLKNELGEDMLHFAVAECDGIEALEPYRGRCEPCFLFFAAGQLVEVIRGAQGPVLARAISEQLAAEHKVLDEGAERKVIKDPMLATLNEQDKERAASAELEDKMKAEEEARTGDEHLTSQGDYSVRAVSENTVRDIFDHIPHNEEPVPKEVTVVLIKPDAVREEKVAEIKQKIMDSGFEILTEEDRTLSEEEAKDFYKDHAEEDHFEALVQFMSGGPSHIMVVTKGNTGEGVVHEVRTLIGPKDTEVAKEEAPDSLRALYGTDKTMNAMHGADSAETAARELSFFFPEFVAPNVPGTGPPPKIQKTLALVRPDALKEHKDSIIEKIKEAGFEVCLQKEVQLTEDQAKEFYKEQEGTPHFEDLIREMTSGHVLALGLAKEEAVQGWRDMLGPKEIEAAKTDAPESLRAQFSHPDSTINALHGSDSPDTAEKELNYFFPVEHTLAVIKPDASTEHKDVIIERIKEAGFNIACQKEMDLPKDLASQLYKEHEGKEFYDNLVDYMTSLEINAVELVEFLSNIPGGHSDHDVIGITVGLVGFHFGPSMVMVLSREDAITGWRTIMGPTDPEVAKEQAPESLRALLGKDILQNAIHGSSTKEHATEKITTLFPEVEIKEDGQLIMPAEEETEQSTEGEDKPAAEGEIEQTTEEQGTDGEAEETEEQGSANEGEDGVDAESGKEEEDEEDTKDGEEEEDSGGEKETDQDKHDEGDEESSPEENKQEDGSSEAATEEGEKTEEQLAEEPKGDEVKTEGDEAKTEGDEVKTDGDEAKPEGDEAKTEGDEAASEEKPSDAETAAATEGTEEAKEEDESANNNAATEDAKTEEAETKAEEAEAAAATPEAGEAKTEDAAKTEGDEAPKPEEEEAAKAEGEAAKPEAEGGETKEDGEAKAAEGDGEKKAETPPAE